MATFTAAKHRIQLVLLFNMQHTAICEYEDVYGNKKW